MVLPARFPNLLVNGAGGIAVGMATNIPPHNLGEVIDACVALIDDPGLSIDDLIAIVPGPDFPTGGIILGRAGIRAAYHLGRGSIVMRGKVEIETLRSEREAIIVTEIPYQVNKAHDGRADRRTGAREEDRGHLRPARRIRPRRLSRRDRAASATPCPTWCSTSSTASPRCRSIVRRQHGGARRRPAAGDEPEGPAAAAFIAFREEVVSRRTKYLLGKARDRAHVLVGLAIAVANIDEVIRLIRAAKDANEAREALMARDWPARDVAAADRADRRSAPQRHRRTAPTGCRPSRPRRSSICACSGSPRSAATRSRPSSTSSPTRSPTISTSCARARASRRSSRTSSPP